MHGSGWVPIGRRSAPQPGPFSTPIHTLGDALQEIAAVDRKVSRGFVRAGKPADLARKLGPERRARAQATAG